MISLVFRVQPAISTTYASKTASRRVASRQVHWLLGFALFCLVAQSTVLPIAAPWASVWDPAHAHMTLDGVVPPHEHVFGGESSAEGGCQVPADTGAASLESDEHRLACAASSEGATASPAVISAAPVDATTGAGALEVGMFPPPPALWTSAALDVTTPPPRTIA